LVVLYSKVSSRVFAIIEDATEFDAAIELLKAQYAQAVNVVHARHLLATRKQRPGEPADEFLQELCVLARACDFKAVSAVKNTEDMIRDAYVAGLSSTYVRQRLLEQADLDLKKAVDLAKSLELALRNTEDYSIHGATQSWTPRTSTSPS